MSDAIITVADATPTEPTAGEDLATIAGLRAALAEMRAAAEIAAAAAPTTGAKIRSAIWKIAGAAFAEVKDGKVAVSLGRVAFVAWMVQASVMWWRLGPGQDLPDSMVNVGFALLGYVTSTKAIEVVAAFIASRRAGAVQ